MSSRLFQDARDKRPRKNDDGTNRNLLTHVTKILGAALAVGLARSMDSHHVLGLFLQLLDLLPARMAPFWGRLHPTLARQPPADTGRLHGSQFSGKAKYLPVVSLSQSLRTASDGLWLVRGPALIQYLVPQDGILGLARQISTPILEAEDRVGTTQPSWTETTCVVSKRKIWVLLL